MAGSLNSVSLIGNLGKDPESRTMQNGNAVVNFSLATSESWNDKSSGERMEQTEWHRVVVFNPTLCDVAQKYLRKGSKVFVQGKLQTRKWTDQAGVEKYATEVVLGPFDAKMVMLDKRDGAAGDDGGGQGQQRQAAQAQPHARQPHAGAGSGAGNRPSWDKPGADLDDEVPF